MQADSPAAVRLAITGLDVRFGARQVVNVDELSLGEAEIVGLAGESGSGKSMTTLAVLGLAHTVGATVRGSITLDGTELTGLSQRAAAGPARAADRGHLPEPGDRVQPGVQGRQRGAPGAATARDEQG